MDRQTKQWIFDRVIWIVGLVMAMFLAATSFAGEREGVVATNDTWSSECGGRRAAYSPGVLPGTGRRVIMAGLDKHFDVDPSVNAATRRV